MKTEKEIQKKIRTVGKDIDISFNELIKAVNVYKAGFVHALRWVLSNEE